MATLESNSSARTPQLLTERTTTNWIANSASKITGNTGYQAWSSGFNNFDGGSNLTSQTTSLLSSVTVASKLDPNSKPFAPRQTIATTSGQSFVKEDENQNLVKWTQDDKMKKIWAMSQNTMENKLGINDFKGPPAKAESPLNLRTLDDANNNETMNYAVKAKSATKVTANANPSTVNVRAKDDFGLRGLVQNIYLSVNSMKSETRSIMNDEDLGFDEEVKKNFVKPYAHQYMESPFNHRVVGPLSDYHVPDEYLHNLAAKGSLPEFFENMSKMATDLLFFLFYASPRDMLQIMIGNELFTRGWRYHKTEKLWVARLPNTHPEIRERHFEQGEYQCFNKETWTREKRKMRLDYSLLASHQQMSPIRAPTQRTVIKSGEMAHFHQHPHKLD